MTGNMTEQLLIKGFFALIFSGMFAYVVFDRDERARSSRGKDQRYVGYVSGLILPAALATCFVTYALFGSAQAGVQMTLGFYFSVFAHICVYYLLLLPLLPLLRRQISARACAVLWILPNYLYITQMSYMRLAEPRWVVSAPSGLVRVLFALWLAGFLAVMGWKILSHLVFRAQILRDAVPVTDPEMLEIWRQEVADARFRRPKFRLVVSPAVRTPLSVGLFGRSVRVVLPQRKYTPDELRLIFRHELVHIGREDACDKFFLVFCTAMCWFYLLMWTAMKKSAEDIELSCDETVLLDAEEDTRRRYAELLLRTAGDERGFTTCLSASAGALRYRMKNVVRPKEKHSGALVVGLVFFVLCMSCGYLALAYGEDNGAQILYHSAGPDQYTLRTVEWRDDRYSRYNDALLSEVDKTALHEYLSGLRMQNIAGNYSYDQKGEVLFLMFDTPEGALGIKLYSQYAVLYSGARNVTPEYYYLPDGVDWEALYTCAPKVAPELQAG